MEILKWEAKLSYFTSLSPFWKYGICWVAYAGHHHHHLKIWLEFSYLWQDIICEVWHDPGTIYSRSGLETSSDDGMTEFQLIKWKLHPTTIEYSSSGKTVLNLLNIKVKLIFWRNMFDLTALCEEWWVSVLVRLFNVGTSMPLRKKHWEAS